MTRIGIIFKTLLFLSGTISYVNANEVVDLEPEYKVTKVKINPFFEDDIHLDNIRLQNIEADKMNPEFVYYTVQDNETLMLIAFELYSDFKAWRQIYKDNKNLLKGSDNIKTNMKLKLRTPLRPREYPRGLPYLIKPRDTLGKISNKIYGEKKFWKAIFNNNKDQIRNPDLIFAGFTLFYSRTPSLMSDQVAELY